MVVRDRGINTDRQQFSLAEQNGVAAKDRWKQDVDVPVQPLPHGLARCRISAPKSAQCFGQMLDDGRRLKMDASAVDKNRDLAPAGKCQELWCLVHSLLKT